MAQNRESPKQTQDVALKKKNRFTNEGRNDFYIDQSILLGNKNVWKKKYKLQDSAPEYTVQQLFWQLK